MKRLSLIKSAEQHERLAAFYAGIGKSKAAARELRTAQNLRKGQQIKRELRRAS